MLNIVVCAATRAAGGTPNTCAVWRADRGAFYGLQVLNGRRFGGRTVVATYLSQAAYAAGQLD